MRVRWLQWQNNEDETVDMGVEERVGWWRWGWRSIENRAGKLEARRE